MNKRPGNVKMAGIVIAAALFVLGVLLAAAWFSVQGGTRDTISLPDASTQTDVTLEPGSSEDVFIRVDRDNIQAVLDVMERPGAYHQTLSVMNLRGSMSVSSTIELWRSGELARAQITGQDRVQNLLTDGTSVWIWYNGDNTAKELQPDMLVRFDDLCGIPTYETLVALEPENILEAGFVTLDDADGLSCLYISAVDGTYEDHYWVDVNTQLLCRADSLENGEQIYQLRQSSCQVVSPEDTSLQNVFRLPDGTVITATEE